MTPLVVYDTNVVVSATLKAGSIPVTAVLKGMRTSEKLAKPVNIERNRHQPIHSTENRCSGFPFPLSIRRPHMVKGDVCLSQEGLMTFISTVVPCEATGYLKRVYDYWQLSM